MSDLTRYLWEPKLREEAGDMRGLLQPDDKEFRGLNRFDGPVFMAEVNSAALRVLASLCLRVAAFADDQHLEADPHWESGIGLTLIDTSYFTRETIESSLKREPRIGRFEYVASAVPVVRSVSMKGGAVCRTECHGEFLIDGNVEAMQSLAECSLDLAEHGTPAGASFTFEPGFQLATGSIPFKLSRAT